MHFGVRIVGWLIICQMLTHINRRGKLTILFRIRVRLKQLAFLQLILHSKIINQIHFIYNRDWVVCYVLLRDAP